MSHRLDSSNKKVTIRKGGVINADWIQEFKNVLSEVDWGTCIQYLAPTTPMNIF